MVRENLESVRHNRRREGQVIRSEEQEDEGNDGMSSRTVQGGGVASSADGLKDEEDQHPDARGDEKDSLSDTFD